MLQNQLKLSSGDGDNYKQQINVYITEINNYKQQVTMLQN